MADIAYIDRHELDEATPFQSTADLKIVNGRALPSIAPPYGTNYNVRIMRSFTVVEFSGRSYKTANVSAVCGTGSALTMLY